MTAKILRQVETLTRILPRHAVLRAGDEIHLASAMDAGFQEIWTNERRLVTVAEHFGVKGRQVAVA